MAMLAVAWRRRFSHRFVSLAVGVPFSENGVHSVLGCEDGVVRMYCGKEGKEKVVECKGGAIAAVVLHNLMQFGTNDVVAGDSLGHLYIYTRLQLLSHITLSHAVTAVAVHEDTGGTSTVIVGDAGGAITCLLPYEAKWRIRLNEVPMIAELGLSQLPNIQCIISVTLRDVDGVPSQYVVAADGSQFLHFICGGVYVMSLLVPCPVRAICSGRFMRKEETGDLMDVDGSGSSNTDAALDLAVAGDDGVVYIIQDFEVFRYADVGHSVRYLCRFPHTNGDYDVLACGGLFNGIVCIYEGERVATHSTTDWVCGLAYGDMDNDGCDKLVLVTRDGTLETLSVHASSIADAVT